MHLLARDPEVQEHLPEREGGTSPSTLTLEHVVRVREQPGVLAKVRAFLLLIVAKLFNNESFESGWRVDLARLTAGGVRIVFSVLYLPWTEIDDPDRDGDYDELLKRLDEVEAELRREPEETRPVVVKREADLDRALAEKRIAVVHCIEGGMHLGANEALIDSRVRDLAQKGITYITLAHLFYRGVATNAPALPMLSDRAYNTIFCQPKNGGLSAIGEAAVRAMYTHGVLVDVSHMRQDALAETFALLKVLDEESGADPKDHPVIATHAGYRLGDQAYMLDDDTIREIAARDGVVGLIMAEHQLYDGVELGDATGFEATLEAVRSHVEAIHGVAGSYSHVGIGSDLDGFIKPTVAGIENADDLKKFREPLAKEFGANAPAILGGNAERVLRSALRARD
jgi:microsomal dipeptidase-like Zn-dependent dipeptidase